MDKANKEPLHHGDEEREVGKDRIDKVSKNPYTTETKKEKEEKIEWTK